MPLVSAASYVVYEWIKKRRGVIVLSVLVSASLIESVVRSLDRARLDGIFYARRECVANGPEILVIRS